MSNHTTIEMRGMSVSDRNFVTHSPLSNPGCAAMTMLFGYPEGSYVVGFQGADGSSEDVSQIQIGLFGSHEATALYAAALSALASAQVVAAPPADMPELEVFGPKL